MADPGTELDERRDRQGRPPSPAPPSRTTADRDGRLTAILQTISRQVLNRVGDSYFRTLVQQLCETLEVDAALVGRLTCPDEVETIALYADGGWGGPLRYPLAGTPCADAMDSAVCVHCSGVWARYPDDRLLQDMGMEGYSGTRLLDSAGRPLGIIVVLSRRPLADPDLVQTVVGVFAERAAAELERRAMEAALRESELRLRTLVDHMPCGLLITDRRGRVTYSNALADGRIDPDCGPLTADVLALESAVSCSLPERDGAGGGRALSIVKFPIPDGGGHIAEVATLSTDITDPVEARRLIEQREKALRRNQAAMLELVRRTLLSEEASADVLGLIAGKARDTLGVERVGIWRFDPRRKGLVKVADSAGLGGRDHLLADCHYPAYFDSLLRDRILSSSDTSRDGRLAGMWEAHLLPNGTTSLLDVCIQSPAGVEGIVCFDWRGPPREWTLEDVGFATSVADLIAVVFARRAREQALEALSRSEQRYRALYESVEETVRQRTRELEEAMASLRAAQEELVRSEKLASLGGIVASVTHEIATPIGSSLTVASTLEAKVGRFAAAVQSGTLKRSTITAFTDDLAEAARLMVRSLGQAADLIGTFKRVAVDQTSDRRRRFDLRTVTAEVLATLRPTFRQIDLAVDLAIPEGLEVDGYPGAWGQVLANLVSNAVTHGFRERGGGTVRIAARPVEDERLEVTVADDGAGMAPDVLRRAFEPFFTTGLSSGGSGLGLHIVYGTVVRVLGGRIRVDSAPGAGTCFVIVLPLTAPEPQPSPVQETSA
ncbi:ATP-binding protein [Azospirillum thermophilum]|nr:ATP-binding protein [Azospirillum thermophilum]